MSHHASGPNFGFPRGDARLDMTDLYAFTKPGDTAKSIIVLDVHPSFRLDSPEPTTKEPFAPGALYEFKIDTDGNAVADLSYSVQFASSGDEKQSATVRRIQGKRAAGVGDEGEVIVQQAPVSVGREANDDRFIGVFAHELEHTGGYTPEDAAEVARTLLPDMLSYDPTAPVRFPHNGRTLTDDVVDVFLSTLTNGKVTGDKVGPHGDLLDEFPYLGPPHE